ncbi:unnamed protein product [Blepharisma stoltei]|uniref:Ubiquitin carboxyl-terminal hydrolase n=1 Tax=Blepharisma stoltei TaxID=1481888 RepID=A0AAU9IUV3_9CILI|nr:unnamed protein product [Blepharisma stoltei]
MAEWCTIESDPGVFTELIKQIGVKGAEVEEIYSIDNLEDCKPVYGLIFLFKWMSGPQKECMEFYDPDLFFANQVITNACATQAILSILLNSKLDIGPELRNLREFAMPLDSQTKGLTIGNSEVIRNAHNSFARQEPFELVKVKATEDDDVFHFVSYIPFNGHIYELDGLQPGPIHHGECNEEDWLEKIKPVLFERIQKYSENEIRFTLLAIVNNKKEIAEAALREQQSHISAIQSKLMSLGVEIDSSYMEIEFDEDYFNNLPDDINQLQSELYAKQEAAKQQQNIVENESFKNKKWKEENVRRRHNYIPFILALLQKLADKNQLIPLLEQAKKKKKRDNPEQQEALNK